ncbi:MAG: hypothetical protein ACTH2U_11055 [Brevibacterium sp.]
MNKVYEIGEDGGRWFVAQTMDPDRARVAIIRQLEEQLQPLESAGGAISFAEEAHEALHAKATQYFFVATDRETELVYSDVPFGPRQDREHNADFLGNPGFAIGFTMPKWSEREAK